MLKRFLGIYFTGIVIKLMDDYLDLKEDKLNEEFNFFYLLHKGILPYTLIIFFIALSFNFNEALTLFSSSYIIGMGYEWKTKYSSGLKGWQESIIIMIITIYFTSFHKFFLSFIFILSAQLIDDLIDFNNELTNFKNTVNIFGLTPTIILILIFILFLYKIDYILIIYYFSALFSLYLTFLLFKLYYLKRLNHYDY